MISYHFIFNHIISYFILHCAVVVAYVYHISIILYSITWASYLYITDSNSTSILYYFRKCHIMLHCVAFYCIQKYPTESRIVSYHITFNHAHTLSCHTMYYIQYNIILIYHIIIYIYTYIEISLYIIKIQYIIAERLIDFIGVSKNRGTPKSSILIGFSIINHPFWVFSPYFLETPI